MQDNTIPFVENEQDYICELCDGQHGFNYKCEYQYSQGSDE